jgi:diguanylate cyclase (GGDEF)-like protein/PAS domain S-box-containing protein
MQLKPSVVLIIGDDMTEAAVREALADAEGTPFIVEAATTLADGLDRLSRRGISAVLLDVHLLDGQDGADLEKVRLAVAHIPMVVIGSADHRGPVTHALLGDAVDYLPRTRLDSYSVSQALRHVIERKAAEEALFFEQQRAEVTLNSIGDAVISIDLLGTVTYLNPVAARMIGWLRDEALGRPLLEVFNIIDATTREAALNPMETAIQLDTTVALTPNCLLVRRDGVEAAIEDSASPIHDRGGQVIGAVIVFHDVTENRALALRAIHLAQHDSITELPNRILLNDRIAQAIALAHRHNHRLAVLFLDLDRFKHVNDSLGHAVGDALLQSVARRLQACVRNSDTVSRHGGDEFVVLLPEIGEAEDAAACAQKIIAALVSPIEIALHQLHVTATIGISIYPDDGPDAATLVKVADAAMYHAKANGRNTYEFSESANSTRAAERQGIEAGLRRALDRREFVLHYQPQINLETRAMTGAEALLRWQHPQRGLLLPKDFVPIAEDCGLMLPIGQWVLREACQQARRWIDEGEPPITVAVNISATEFRDPRFLINVRTILNESHLAARYLELELTETALVQRPASTALVLHALRDMGVQVAIDDFGTGYSSLSHLRQFPASVLKIDQSFVSEIGTDPMGASIVRAVINMGRSLGHRIIAEGVETREQLAFLEGLRCSEAQGYYFSRPLVAAEFVSWRNPTAQRASGGRSVPIKEPLSSKTSPA